MKNIGLGILVVGVALCASYGARLSPDVRDELAGAGKAKMTAAAEGKAQEAYCAALKAASLDPRDGCPDEKKAPAEETAAEEPAGKTAAPPADVASVTAAGKAKLAGLRADGPTDQPEAVAKAREAWLAAMEAAIEPGAVARFAPKPQPGARVSSWFAQSGMFFLIGLVFVVIGAVIARRAVKAEARSDGPTADGSAPVDFGALLNELHDDVQALVDGLTAHSDAQAMLEARSTIEGLQTEKVDRLVEARGRLQARYGIGGYAEVFGPFSSAERRLNRSWSALVDGHLPEARDSLAEAVRQLEAAKVQLDGLVAS